MPIVSRWTDDIDRFRAAVLGVLIPAAVVPDSKRTSNCKAFMAYRRNVSLHGASNNSMSV